MHNKQDALKNKDGSFFSEQCYWIYMLEMKNGSLYTGYTNNIIKRYAAHKTGKKGAKFTRSFKPIKIAQCWQLFESRGTALKVELFIKAQERKTKLQFVENPALLSTMFFEKRNICAHLVPVDLDLLNQ